MALAVAQLVPSALSLPFVATYHVAALVEWARAQAKIATEMKRPSFIVNTKGNPPLEVDTLAQMDGSTGKVLLVVAKYLVERYTSAS